MMLKIQRPEMKSNVTPPWVIFSDILNVYYVTITGEHYKHMIKDFDGNTPGNYPFDYTAVVGDNPKRVITVEATRKNGTSLYVVFNTTGYLLNDEGKTLETLKL